MSFDENKEAFKYFENNSIETCQIVNSFDGCNS